MSSLADLPEDACSEPQPTETRGRTGDDSPASRQAFVQGLARGLDVIRSFGPDRSAMTLSQVSRATGLTRASARRALLTLAELGYVRSEGQVFSLTPKVLELGYAYLSGLSLDKIVEPHLRALVEMTHEVSSLTVLNVPNIVYLVRFAERRFTSLHISVGSFVPAHATAMGQVLLAHLTAPQIEHYLKTYPLERFTDRTVTDETQFREILSNVRARGYAITDQELVEGIRAVAVPVRDSRDSVIAAINICGQPSRVSILQLRREALPRLKETARLIEADLAARDGNVRGTETGNSGGREAGGVDE